jgi:hypothetical protein
MATLYWPRENLGIVKINKILQWAISSQACLKLKKYYYVPVPCKYNSSKKDIYLVQVNDVLQKIKEFKQEGSTTKWFSGDVLSLDYIQSKFNISS